MKKSYINLKLVLDTLFALIGFLFLLLLFAIIAIAIKIDSPGEVMFKQERNGKDGKIFKVYKFRTMKTTHEEFKIEERVIKDNDSRVTRIGRLLRKTKLDEIPQLINIIRGEMSFVGPRPVLPIYNDIYENWELKKFDVRPGLTGLAQVMGNGELSVQERSYYDVIYALEGNFKTDCKVFFKTFKVIFKGEKSCLVNVPQDKINELKESFENLCYNTNNKGVDND